MNMGKRKKKRKNFKLPKKPNIDHFAHQATVTGVGAHQNKKKKIFRKRKHKGKDENY